MSKFSRRDTLRYIALAAAAGHVTAQDGQHVHEMANARRQKATGVYQPKALTPHEYATLERLTDLIIPVEGSSPGALAAGSAAWIDMLAGENPRLLEIYSGGLGWMDRAMVQRAGKDFVSSTAAEQTALLDKIAYRKNDGAEFGPGIRFFDWARRMTVDAYYTSPIGIKDIDFRGNTPMSKFEVPADAIEYALKRSGQA
jgi:hypothetical protein